MDLKRAQRFTSEMTFLEVIERYRETESVFRKYDEQVGVCLCCQALFETLAAVAEKYRLLSFVKVMELSSFLQSPLTLPSPPFWGRGEGEGA